VIPLAVPKTLARALFAAGLIFVLILADGAYFRGRIYPGVHCKQVNLGGKRQAQVESLLDNLTMHFGGPRGKTIAVPLRDLGITLDSEAIFAAAYRLGRRSTRPRAYLDRLALLKHGAVVPPLYSLDGALFRQSLEELERAFTGAPQNARFLVCGDGGGFTLLPETPGYTVAKDELHRAILQTLLHPDHPFFTAVPVTEKVPPVTVASLREKGIVALRGTFTTAFDPEKEDRAHNIALAAAVLHNTFLAPGEVLSVNAIVGDTTPDKGYRRAPVMIGGELVEGYGGGLCQISSTLYNAALLAGLEIFERYNHEMTVPYVDPGRDATISYGAKDLQFRNNTGNHLLIHATVTRDTLTFSILGAPPAARVEIETRVLAVYEPPVRYRFDPSLAPGAEEVDEGSPGYLVEVWKVVYRGEPTGTRSMVSLDSYHPHPTVIRRGP
jgi:vancomycin resistance protein YoaR